MGEKINLSGDYIDRIGENLIFETQEDFDFVHNNIFGLKAKSELIFNLTEDFGVKMEITPKKESYVLNYQDEEYNWRSVNVRFLTKLELKKIRPKISLKKL